MVYNFSNDLLLFDYLPRTTSLTLQALSEDDYRMWLAAMDGKEPVSIKHGFFIFKIIDSDLDNLFNLNMYN